MNKEETLEHIGSTLLIVMRNYDKGAYLHCKRVSEGINILYGELTGDYVGNQSLVHDIGKIGVSDIILHKPGPLSVKERLLAQCHSQVGMNILKQLVQTEKKLSPQDLLDSHLFCTAAYHHEHYDGSGYPKGFSEGEIPLIGRITSAMDVFDAIIEKRSYKPSQTIDEAVSFLETQSNKMFDPLVVELIKKNLSQLTLEVYPKAGR